jgi:glycerol 2-dehydrogenase (NADP+)
MQKMLDSGKVKNIGVSNFQIRHLEKLLRDPTCKVVPAVNQLEVRKLQEIPISSECALSNSVVQLHPYNPS